MPRLFEVTILASVKVKMEITADTYDEAEDIAMNTYTLRDAWVIAEHIDECEDVTEYRLNA